MSHIDALLRSLHFGTVHMIYGRHEGRCLQVLAKLTLFNPYVLGTSVLNRHLPVIYLANLQRVNLHRLFPRALLPAKHNLYSVQHVPSKIS